MVQLLTVILNSFSNHLTIWLTFMQIIQIHLEAFIFLNDVQNERSLISVNENQIAFIV